MKQIVRTQYSKSADKTKFTFDDGTEEIVSGTPDKAVPKSIQTTPGRLEAAGLGAAQGLTFGFGDELYGAGAGAIDTLTGDKELSLDTLMEAYKANRDAARQRMESAEEANPITYNAANILSSFAIPAGAIGAVGKGASLGQKALAGAKAGAAAGALGAVGTSDTDLTSIGTVGDLASDAAKGAVIGGGLGATLGGVAPAAINKLDDVMSQFKAFQITKNALNKARAGEELFGEVPKDKLLKKTRELGEDVVEGLERTQSSIGKGMGNLIKEESTPVVLDKAVQELTESAPFNLVNKKEDISKLNDVVNTLNNTIQKVERKEIVGYTPVGKVGKDNQQKIMDKIQQVVAAGNKTAYDTLARFIVKREQGLPLGELRRSLEKVGIDSRVLQDSEGKLTKEALQLAQSLKDPEDIIQLSKMLQESQILPAPRIVQELDPQTGLEVIRSVRGDSTISAAIPKQVEDLVTKVKPIFETKTIVGRPKLSSEELNTAIQDLKSYASDSNISTEIRKYASEAATKLENMRSPDVKATMDKLKSKYADTVQAKAELNIDKKFGTTAEDRAARVTKEQEVGKTIEDLFEGDTQKSRGFEKAMSELRKVNPKLANKLEKQAENTSLDLATARALTAESGLGGNADILSKLTQVAGRTIPSAAAHGIGKGIRAVETTGPKALQRAGKSLYEASPEKLQMLADSLSQKASPYADKLQHALQQPLRKRNALLFTLLQQPGFRQSMEEMVGLEDDSGQ